MTSVDFDALGMQLARSVAQAATAAGKVPQSKIAVGCVLMSPDRRKLSYGYSGTPKGYPEEHGLAAWDAMCIHAELNAILNSAERPQGWTLYSTKAPCLECCKAIAQAGVARVVCPPIDPSSRWADSQKVGDLMHAVLGINRTWKT